MSSLSVKGLGSEQTALFNHLCQYISDTDLFSRRMNLENFSQEFPEKLPDLETIESDINALVRAGLCTWEICLPGEAHEISVTPEGMNEFHSKTCGSYRKLQAEICCIILRQDGSTSSHIATELGANLITINTILEFFAARRYIAIAKSAGSISIVSIPPDGARFFKTISSSMDSGDRS